MQTGAAQDLQRWKRGAGHSAQQVKYLSMMPPRRMALFQSFRVDFPARWTKCFGLISWSLNCQGDKQRG